MSEEKLYAVKNDEGKFWEFFDNPGFWSLDISDSPITPSKYQAEQVANEHGGHIVTFVEEPEKVVLSKEQAEIVEGAHGFYLPASFISSKSDDEEDEELLMNAYVNGYTVAKEKKCNVKVPHVPLYYWKKPNGGLGIDDLNVATADDDTDDFEFTEAEIEHYGLQDCEKEEVTDDGE
ncbi:DUF1642 domain-containing protein [Lacticaseibacillus paracasei]|uniref:DUF1642 domain-containing protein n=1 Tax=Lacticaseibacillus paracasei TaxID=1597 RepID=UPI003CFE170E